MQNATIDNSIEPKKAILWQYDKAKNLLALVSIFNELGIYTTTRFWNKFLLNEASIDTATNFGLAIWGAFIGQPWLTYKKDGVATRISDSLYRRILKGKIYLITSNGSLASINKYLSIVFDSKIIVSDGFDMSITYRTNSELTDEEEAVKEELFIYPAAVKTNIAVIDPQNYIGLNKFNKYIDESGAEITPTEQNLCNLCDSQDDDNPNKGILYVKAFAPIG